MPALDSSNAPRDLQAEFVFKARKLKDELDSVLHDVNNNGQNRKKGTNGKNGHTKMKNDLRSQLETVYYKMLLNCDEETIESEGVENNLWTYVFYSKIDEYRKKIKQAMRESQGTSHI